MSDWKLNENSKTVKQPKQFVGELRQHQLAMFYRALSIEKQQSEFAFGFLADRAGTGKTPVVISLMLADLQVGYTDRQTLIVCPQNIMKQWISEIDRFSGGVLTVRELNYNDVSDITSTGSLVTLRGYNVLMITQTFFETMTASLSSNGSTIYRIVYDEIDTMDKDISMFKEKKDMIKERRESLIKQNQNKDIHILDRERIDFVPPMIDRGLINRITWFVSASIYNMIDPKTGFFFLGKQIPNSELQNLFVKCHNYFIDDNLPPMEDEEEVVYRCDCVADAFSNFLSVDQLDAMNSLSYDEVKLTSRRRVPNTDLELMTMLVKQYYTEMDEIVDVISECEKKMEKMNIREDDTRHPIMVTIIKKEKKFDFNKKVVSGLHTISHRINTEHVSGGSRNGDTEHNCQDEQECTIKALEVLYNSTVANSKLSVLREILKEIKRDTPIPKILIFSDFQGSFKHIPRILDESDIKLDYEDMCKGSPEGIAKAVSLYKGDLVVVPPRNVNVLFIHSRLDGCGLNLENTTHLIFLHRTDDRLRDQILGRAQRQGRVGVLKVISLYNENEDIDGSEEGSESEGEESGEEE